MIKKELQQELNRTKLVLDYARQEIKEKGEEIERLNKQYELMEEALEDKAEEIERINNIIKELEKYLDTLHWFRLGKKEENGNMEYFYASVSNFYEDTKSILKGSE